MGLNKLPDSGKVFVDSQIVIYIVEQHPIYADQVQSLWERAKLGRISLVSSTLALMECLVLPYRESDAKRISDFEFAFFQSEIQTIDISTEILKQASRIRAAVPSCRTPDAIHVATAIMSRCDSLVTNDSKVEAVFLAMRK